MQTQFNNKASDKRWVDLTGVMNKAGGTATAPARPTAKTAASSRRAANDAKAHQGGGDLAGLLVGLFMGTHILAPVMQSLNAPAGLPSTDVVSGAEAADEFYQDRLRSAEIRRGATPQPAGFSLGQRNVLNGGFAMSVVPGRPVLEGYRRREDAAGPSAWMPATTAYAM